MRLFLRLSCIVLLAGVVVAATRTSAKQSSLSIGLSPALEIAELEAKIALTKESGFPVDPEWTARLVELLPLVSDHPGNARLEFPFQSEDGGFAPGAVIRPQQLTPLEQQIRELEFQFTGGLGSEEPDAVTRATLKEQLHELYMQRNTRENANPLDQGADFCPGTLVTGIPYTDTGTTAGMGNYYNPIAPCAPTASPEVVYRFEPSSTMQYTISLLGSSYDTYLYVNTAGACPGALQLACNDDFGGLQSQVTLTLSAGQTYFIIVDGYGTDSFGDYVLNISDNCDITCQPGDVIECPEVRESLHAGTDCNGSCNLINYGGAPVSQDILPFQTICGRGFTYIGPNGGNFRDTDFYRFTLTEAGELVTLNGYPVLDAGGGPIQIDANAGPIMLSADGQLNQAGRPVAALGIFEADLSAGFVRAGNSGIIPTRQPQPIVDRVDAGVVQGYVEESNVNAIGEMT